MRESAAPNLKYIYFILFILVDMNEVREKLQVENPKMRNFGSLYAFPSKSL